MQSAGKSNVGYAIMSKTGKMQIFDARLPVYWKRSVAHDDMLDKGYDGIIVRVVFEKDE